MPTVRPWSVMLAVPPTEATSDENVASSTVLVPETPRRASRVCDGASVTTPFPPAVLNAALPPDSAQAPPRSAAPHPPVVVRSNSSVARGVGPAGSGGVTTGAVTVTGFVTEWSAPSSSVTVSVTLYVPEAA